MSTPKWVLLSSESQTRQQICLDGTGKEVVHFHNCNAMAEEENTIKLLFQNFVKAQTLLDAGTEGLLMNIYKIYKMAKM